MEIEIVRLLTSSFAVIFALLCYQTWRRNRHKLPLPPGPKGLPIVGNLFQLPTVYEWETYHAWCKDFGTDILYLNAAGSHVIVLDSLEAATCVLDQDSGLCSDRARLPMVRELMGWESAFQFKDYGDAWRIQRKIFHQEMNVNAAPRFRVHQIRATRRFLKRLMAESSGVNVVEEVRTLSGEIVISITYGFECASEAQHYVQLSKDAIQPLVDALTPGAYLVDFFPFLKYVPSWIPGASFKRKAKADSELRLQMFNKGFEEVKNRIGAGTELPPSFVSFSLENIDPKLNKYEYEESIKEVAGSIYAAGGDTTLAVVTTAIHVLLNYPDAAKRAQQEMDGIIGFGNLPTFDDEEALPFTKSLILEIQRWKDPFPFGLPHVSASELEYKGYRIPKGSMVIGNAWGILQNEQMFKDAHLFKPDRYLTSDGLSIDPSVPQPSVAIFGFGRRVCPGRYVAEASIWLALSSLIAAFNFHRVDETGGPDHPFASGCLRVPNEFTARFEPRSEALGKFIEEFQEN